MRFSERMGFEPPRSVFQYDSLDRGTRARLWNAIRTSFITDPKLDSWWQTRPARAGGSVQVELPIAGLFRELIDQFYKEPLDAMMPYPSMAFRRLQGEVVEKFDWFRVMNLIEFLAQKPKPQSGIDKDFSTTVNRVLADEVVSWRLVRNCLVPVTDPQEVKSVEGACASSVDAVAKHFSQALELLSKRDAVEFDASIAAALQGVEAAARAVTGKPSATFGSLLPVLRDRYSHHPALISVFEKLYGWASDGGIRHAQRDDHRPANRDLAKCIVVMCSAFANLLISSQDS